MTITHFWDMASGGGRKEPPYDHIYIEAHEDEARVIFYNRFGHSPDRVTCTCCGEDYAVTEYATLDDATKFHRGAGLYGVVLQRKQETVEEHLARPYVLFIPRDEIRDSERIGEVPQQGYVWIE